MIQMCLLDRRCAMLAILFAIVLSTLASAGCEEHVVGVRHKYDGGPRPLPPEGK